METVHRTGSRSSSRTPKRRVGTHPLRLSSTSGRKSSHRYRAAPALLGRRNSSCTFHCPRNPWTIRSYKCERCIGRFAEASRESGEACSPPASKARGCGAVAGSAPSMLRSHRSSEDSRRGMSGLSVGHGRARRSGCPLPTHPGRRRAHEGAALFHMNGPPPPAGSGGLQGDSRNRRPWATVDALGRLLPVHLGRRSP